jgi:hypothetical protein
MEIHTWRASGRNVFVCGSPYTEVSSVAWALTAHPAFWTSSESRFLYPLFGNRADNGRPYLYDIYCSRSENGAWMHANAVPYPEFLAALGDGIGKLFQSRAGRKRWIDNSPENALLIEELVHMFPEASFVGLLQPVRTAAFIETSRHTPMTEQLMADLTSVNTLYAERLAKAASAMPNRVYLLDESDLFDRPDTALADLLEFLGEENNEKVANMFAGRLLRLNLPLVDAREALSRFDQSSAQSPPLQSPPLQLAS